MVIKPLGACNEGVSCSIMRGTYLGGGALSTWRALSPKKIGPSDIYLGGYKLDLRMFGLRNILHGGWLWTQAQMLRRSIEAW